MLRCMCEGQGAELIVVAAQALEVDGRAGRHFCSRLTAADVVLNLITETNKILVGLFVVEAITKIIYHSRALVPQPLLLHSAHWTYLS